MTQIEHPAAYEAAIKRNIIMNASKTFLKNVQDAYDLISYVESRSEKSEFCRSLLFAYQSYGKLTEKQCEAIRKSIARDAELKAKWAAEAAIKNASRKYLGEVGKKIEVIITVKAEIAIERPKFHYYDSGVSYLRVCEDADGNVITFNGTAAFPAKGETARISATVKSHRDYNGTPQTLICRPKIIA